MSPLSTPLSKWLARNKSVKRDELVEKLTHMKRQNLDRLARGERRPTLDQAFDIEEATKVLSEGKSILEARAWWRPAKKRPKRKPNRPRKAIPRAVETPK
jgi:hypothetical protein